MNTPQPQQKDTAAPGSVQPVGSALLVSGKTAWRIISNLHLMVWRDYKGSPLWVMVRDVTGHGSGASQEICRSANLDPHQHIGPGKLSPNDKLSDSHP